MIDPVVELLEQQSASKLSAMLGEVDRQIDDLRVQRQWIERALRSKSDPSDAAGRSPGAARAARTIRTPRQRQRRRSEKRDAVVEILRSAGIGKPLALGQVHEALSARGVDSTPEAARVLLRRMASDGEVVREDDGYRLPSYESAERTAPEDDQMSAPGYGARGTLAPTDGSG